MTDSIKSLLLRVSRSMPRQRGSGSGWLEKKDGQYIGCFRDYSLGTGRKLRRVLGPIKDFSEREAKKKLAQVIRDFTPTATMAFSAAAQKYLELRSPGWGKNHTNAIESILKVQVFPRLGAMRVGDIKPSHVQAALNEIAASESDSAVKKAQTHIGGVLEMLVGDDVLSKNAARNANVRKPKTRRVDRTVLLLEEAIALIGAAKDERDRLLLMILFSCAFRPSEVFALRLNDLRDGKLHIDEVATPGEKPRKEGKTKDSFAGVPISADLDLEVRMYAMREMMQPDEFLFPSEIGTAMSHNNWRKRSLSKIAKTAGVKRVDFRIIRRTVATLAQEFGGPKDIQTLLRHKDISTTMGIYVQPSAPSVQRMVDGISGALRGVVN